MDRLLARLERRIGRFAIPRLAMVIAITSAVVYALDMMRPGFLFRLMLIPQLVAAGEVWRLISWIFVPPGGSLFWTAIAILFYANVGTTLEGTWGSFKLNVYYLIGILGTIAGAFATGMPMTSVYLHPTIFLAWGTLFPNEQILLFFIVPVRAKWIAMFTGAMLAWQVVVGHWGVRVSVLVALANYLIFFAKDLLDLVRGAARVERQRARRAAFERDEDERPKRACNLCGLTDDDPDADLRVCTCQEVCGGKPTVYCLKHARSHNAK